MRSHDLDFPYCAFHIRFRFESLVNSLPLRKTSQKPTLVNSRVIYQDNMLWAFDRNQETG